MKSRIVFAVGLCAALGAGSYFHVTTQSEKSVVQSLQSRIEQFITKNDGVPGGISHANGRTEAERVKIGSYVAMPLRHLIPDEGSALDMPNGSMAAKLAAACDFGDRGGVSGIGRLAEVFAFLDGTAGPRVFQAS